MLASLKLSQYYRLGNIFIRVMVLNEIFILEFISYVYIIIQICEVLSDSGANRSFVYFLAQPELAARIYKTNAWHIRFIHAKGII